jgi:hypothetical protein
VIRPEHVFSLDDSRYEPFSWACDSLGWLVQHRSFSLIFSFELGKLLP